MKARSIHRIIVIASIFASFVIYLCVSLADIMPFFFIIALCAVSVALDKLVNRGFTAIKLYTQKAE
jgi:hypothetical protein